MLKVYVRENNFKNKKKKHAFHSRTCGTVTREQFSDIVANSNTTVTCPDTIAVMAAPEAQFDRLISEEYAVQLPMGTFRAEASGTAETINEVFSPCGRSHTQKSTSTEHDHTISLLFEVNRKKEKSLKAESPMSGTKSVRLHSENSLTLE